MRILSCVLGVAFMGCSGVDLSEGSLEEASTRWARAPGEQQQGTQLLGEAAASQIGVRTTGLQDGASLHDLSVYRGELIGLSVDPSGVVRTLRGAELVGASLQIDTEVGTSSLVIEGVRSAALDGVDPTGDSWLYRLAIVKDDRTRALFCKADPYGRSEAIPVAARWNRQGDRLETSALDARFSFACLSGVVAKCYGWGYRPWESAELRELHQSCTRAARADYCGDGRSHTFEGTPVNFFDLPLGYIPRHALAGFLFEGGWTVAGARCLSKSRWDALPASPLCTDFARRGPHDPQLGRIVCNTVETVRTRYPDVHVFTESRLRPIPPGS